jgi:biopolymer transport protein ExbD
MAMNLKSPADEAEPIMDINTTPLIDVLLVLLVMLIITIPIQLHNVNLSLPVGTPPPVVTPPDVVRLDIDEQGVVHWNGDTVARVDWQARMAEAARSPTQPEVHVRPDKDSRYDVFAAVMADASQAGLVKLGVVGSEQFATTRAP